jgi:hypothetical protein
MARKKTYDPKCYELAEHFLSDETDLNHKAMRESLAADVQQYVEEWIQGERDYMAAH